MNKRNMFENAMSNIDFVERKRAEKKTFSEIALALRGKGVCVSSGACSKAYNKYHNVKTVVGNVVFDSKKEASRYFELAMLEKSGIIKNLERQKRFEVVPKNGDERAVFYVADFCYIEQSGKLIAEDVKSAITRKNPVYIIKRKLFKIRYKEYEFREV